MKFPSVLIALIMSISACAHDNNGNKQRTNTIQAQQAPYVLLISIDGFRWDYIKKYQPKFLSQWVQDSAQLDGLRPSFPTKTFPNHLSIITGSYPQRHGIMANRFYAPDLNKHYSLSKPETVLNPDFYLVDPLWVLAEKQGMRTSSYFWPGSEATISGYAPSDFMQYDRHTPHAQRIAKIIQWYQLPPEERPHLTTMYLNEVDAAGHDFGQDSPELVQALDKVDNTLKLLFQELARLPIDINIVLVSDHGMAQRNPVDFEKLPSWLPQHYDFQGGGPIVHLYDTKGTKKSLIDTTATLNKLAKHYQCYQYQDIPKKLNASQSNRIGDITCLADKDWAIGLHSHSAIGDHGWSQFDSTDMDGIFYAKGPAFNHNVTLPVAENIHIMPMLANILGIKIEHAIDGDAKVLAPLLKH